MPDSAKKPCCICRRWFRPNPRIGTRQRACGRPECQTARRKKTQSAWRTRNPDYFIARRIQARGTSAQPPEPLRLPPPLTRLPWDIAQDEFGVKGADFIGVMGTLLLRPRKTSSKLNSLAPNNIQDHFPKSPRKTRSGSQYDPHSETGRAG